MREVVAMKRSVSSARVLGAALILLCVYGSTTSLRSADYVVSAEDKLKVKIYQFPELAGEYTVNSSGMISIAPIGEIPAAGASARDIAKEISDRLIKAGLADRPGTTVEVVQSRPFYVMGDVQRPGEYAFRPGVTVLQAVSLAGGWYRFSDPGLLRLEREAITIKGDLRNQARRYYQLVARRARLYSELEQKKDVNFPAELVHRASADGTVAQLIDEERSFLNINVDSLKSQIESLETTRTLYEREIEAVSKQILSTRKQAESVQRELAEVAALFARGLAPVSRKTGLERTQAEIAIAEQGLQTLILRARQNITQIEQRIFDLNYERRARIYSELQATRTELEEVSIKLETNKSLMIDVKFTTPLLVSTSEETGESRSVTIVRVVDGKTVSIPAEENQELRPGDVLKVQRTMPLPAGIDRLRPHEVMIPASDIK
jgi:protein involved in polysaccharide export with SLBB domain